MSRAPRSKAAQRSWGTDDSHTQILHVDMDAFFAAVELRENPALRGKPIIVGGSNGRGVVAAASYEARKFGVNSAMPIATAMRLCPQAVVLPGQHRLYAEVSQQVMTILGEVTPQLEQLSIDEAFLDVSGARLRMGTPVQIGSWIRQQIRQRVQVPASVGIAATKFVAKLASAHAKPDGLLLIPAQSTQAFLDTLPVGAMWGIGEKSAQALARWGINDVKTLSRTEPRRLEQILGSAAGRRISELAQGIDPRPVAPTRVEKSLGTENTFYQYITDREQARKILLDQCHQCAVRLRAHRSLARVVVLKVRGADFFTVTRSRTLSAPTDLAQDIWQEIANLYEALPTPAGGYRLLGVRVEALQSADEGVQLLLDENPRRGSTERAADRVRQRWGKGVIGPASLISKDGQFRSER